MTDWRADVERAVKAFVAVAALADVPIKREDLIVEFLEAPHKPPLSLPSGKMAIYGFWHEGKWLKIGMAGPKSEARYVSQHYNPRSARSTLAASLAKDPRMSETPGFDKVAPGAWIKLRTRRLNILVSDHHDKALLALFEAFMHVRLRPRYEK